MKPDNRLTCLYLINLALIFTHEIDSAYWAEWELFHLPGGIQFFLVANLALLLAGLYGFVQVVGRTAQARLFSLLLAGAGLFAFSIHSIFLIAGTPQFRMPVSLLVIAAFVPVSLVQGYLALRAPAAAVQTTGAA